MISVVKRIFYRREALTQFYVLLYAYPGGHRRIFKDRSYAPFKQVIDKCFADGINPNVAALELATIVMGLVLPHLPADDRKRMRGQLNSINYFEFAEDLRLILSGAKKLPDKWFYGTFFIATAINGARNLYGYGKIEEADLDRFQYDVGLALSGLSPEVSEVYRLLEQGKFSPQELEAMFGPLDQNPEASRSGKGEAVQ
jgi:hypothetical protein